MVALLTDIVRRDWLDRELYYHAINVIALRLIRSRGFSFDSVSSFCSRNSISLDSEDVFLSIVYRGLDVDYRHEFYFTDYADYFENAYSRVLDYIDSVGLTSTANFMALDWFDYNVNQN